MQPPPRPILTREEISKLSHEERTRAIAEWSSYNARLRLEQERASNRGRGRGGRGRGRGYKSVYHPYPRAHPPQPPHHLTTTFNEPARRSAPGTPPTPVLNNASPKQPETPIAHINTPCPAFTSTGICNRNRCPYVHDPEKTAICKQFLFKGACPKGPSCPLSHEPTPERSPHCSYFQDGHCTMENCRYAHIHVNEDAPVCEPFARLGYCEKGAQCVDRHEFECPDFANKGTCDNEACRLPHVRHAARLRKARGSAGASPSSRNDSDEDEDMAGRDDHAHALTQQADYIPLGS